MRNLSHGDDTSVLNGTDDTHVKELAFVRSAARAAVEAFTGGRTTVSQPIGSDLNWSAVVALAGQHGVIGLAADMVRSIPDDRVPSAARAQLEGGAITNTASSLAAIAALDAAIALLRRSGIVAAAAPSTGLELLGVGAAGVDYAMARVLVAAADEPAVTRLLCGAKYRVEIETTPEPLAALETLRIANRTLPVLRREHRLDAICARAATDRWSRVDDLAAIAILTRQIENWPRVPERSRARGHADLVSYSIWLVAKLLSIDLSVDADAATPRKLILRQFQSPGDLVMLTAAVRDLHATYPGRFMTDVRTSAPDLWAHNPYVTPISDDDPDALTIECEYPLIHQSNQRPVHFIHGFIEFLNDRLDLEVRLTAFKGDLWMSEAERTRPSPSAELAGYSGRYWIVAAGGKFDFTIKWWAPERYQRVVDHFRGRLKFVQIGEANHHHPPLDGVIDLRGRTSLRDLIRLVYWSDGVLGPVSLPMHLAAAVEVPPGRPPARPSVVIAGGREPYQWEAYPGHQFLHTIGALPCCEKGGCWRSRTLPLGDGDPKDAAEQLCVNVVGELPRCMDMIRPEDVIREIERHLPSRAGSPLGDFEQRGGDEARLGPRPLEQHRALDGARQHLHGVTGRTAGGNRVTEQRQDGRGA